MRDIRKEEWVKLEPLQQNLDHRNQIITEAAQVNWRSDGLAGEHLVQRRLAMAEVIDYCVNGGLDVGCQANKIVPSDAERGYCFGIDHDSRSEFINPQSRWTCDITADGRHLLYLENEFDWVFAGHVLEDQPYPKGTLEMLREFYRVVKNGGYIILLMPHKRYYPNVGHPDANPAHQRDWLPENLLHFVNEHLACELQVVQLESFYNNFEFDAVFRVVKDGDKGRDRRS